MFWSAKISISCRHQLLFLHLPASRHQTHPSLRRFRYMSHQQSFYLLLIIAHHSSSITRHKFFFPLHSNTSTAFDLTLDQTPLCTCKLADNLIAQLNTHRQGYDRFEDRHFALSRSMTTRALIDNLTPRRYSSRRFKVFAFALFVCL